MRGVRAPRRPANNCSSSLQGLKPRGAWRPREMVNASA